MTLSTSRLICTRFTARDWPFYFQLVGDETVMRYITRIALSGDQARVRFANVLKKNQQHPLLGFFAVWEKGSGVFVGLSKLEYMKPGKAEIGYALLPQFWRRGYATELVDFFLEYAKALPELRELIGIIDPENPVSRKILERAGFTLYEKGYFGDLPAEYYSLKLVNR